MTISFLDLSNRFPVNIVEGLRLIKGAADHNDIQLLMVGATAREAVLRYGFGIAGPATRDIDFGVSVNGWGDFDSLKKSLISTEKFRSTTPPHRLISDTHNLHIDIIPFGNIESPSGKIKWNNDHEMIVSGFEEALDQAWTIQFGKELNLKVVSPCGLALLKLVSWTDRSANRDAADFWLVAMHYLDLGNYDRLFKEFPELLEADDYDDVHAGAVMLGRDLREMARSNTILILKSIFEDPSQIEKLYIAIHSEVGGLESDNNKIEKVITGIRFGLGL